MPALEEMQNLAREITTSFDARLASIASLQQSVGRTLGELARSRQAMAAEQQAHLVKLHAELDASVGRTLGELARSRQAMAAEQRTARAAADASRRSAFRAWFGLVSAAQGAISKEWQRLAATMRERRASQSAAMPGGPSAEPAAAAPTAKNSGGPRLRRMFAKRAKR